MNTSNNQPTDISADGDQWAACDGCQLQSLASRLRAQFMRKCGLQCCKKGAIMAVVALLIATPFLLQPATIPCATCVERFVPYHSHLAGNLSDPTISDAKLEEVRRHLEQCEMCRGEFEQAYPGVLGGVALGGVASLGSLAFLLVASLGRNRKWERSR